MTGLRIKHTDLDLGRIRIAQRNWRSDIDEPKTVKSRVTLALGALADRYRAWIAGLKRLDPEHWIFPQDNDHRQPM